MTILPVTQLGPSGQSPVMQIAQQLMRPGSGIGGLAGNIAGALLAKRDMERREEAQKQNRTSFQQAMDALMGGVKEFRNPDDPTQVLVPGREPGIEAFAQVLGGNPRLAPHAANIMAQALQQRQAANQPKFLNVPGVGLVRTQSGQAETVIPAQPKQTPLMRNLQAAGIDPSSAEGQEIIRQSVTKPLASLNVTNKEESEEAKVVGRFRGEQFKNFQSAAQSARNKLARLDDLERLLGQVSTGAGAQTLLSMKRAAKRFGIDLEAMGITDDVAPAEAAQAIASEMALELRNPAGGAGMPGAMSDKDREFLQSMVAGLSQTAEGRKLLIEATRRVEQRKIEVGKMSSDYRKRHGQLDEGFDDALAERFADGDMFGDLTAPEASQTGFEGPNADMTDAELLRALGLSK